MTIKKIPVSLHRFLNVLRFWNIFLFTSKAKTSHYFPFASKSGIGANNERQWNEHNWERTPEVAVLASCHWCLSQKNRFVHHHKPVLYVDYQQRGFFYDDTEGKHDLKTCAVNFELINTACSVTVRRLINHPLIKYAVAYLSFNQSIGSRYIHFKIFAFLLMKFPWMQATCQ